MEKQHKQWCESEMSDTNDKKQHHQFIVDQDIDFIANDKEVITEKQRAIADTNDQIAEADKNFEEATAIREHEKAEFEKELQNYQDAIQALNQAINLLAKFYAKKNEKKSSFAQVSEDDAESDEAAPRAVAPGVFDDVYEQKGGAGVVEMITTVRTEFEHGKKDLEQGEAQSVKDYEKTKNDYQSSRSDLVESLNRYTVEEQGAQGKLTRDDEDKTTNEAEVKAATSYLLQLAGSCDSLLEHYDQRVKLRKDEKKSIKAAIKILEDHA